MTQGAAATIAVVGATGLQGGAVTRALLTNGWAVRALTRDPSTGRAQAVAALGAQVVQADSSDVASLERAFEGVQGVYSVQNHHVSGYEGEIRQGRTVAEAAKATGVRHLVYASAGPGQGATGVGSWDTKIEVEEHAHRLDVPLTVLRPMAFMELMTEPKFYPPAGVWHMMPKLMGSDRPVGWLAVDDLAAIAVRAFAEPERFVGRDLALTSDVRSIAQCREIWRDVTGKRPARWPLTRWLFERFSGTDETTMWRWLRTHEIELDTTETLAILPDALTVRRWLVRTRAAANDAVGAGHDSQQAPA